MGRGAIGNLTGQKSRRRASALKCGYPTIVPGQNGALIAFWCREDCTFVIRWVQLDLSPAFTPHNS